MHKMQDIRRCCHFYGMNQIGSRLSQDWKGSPCFYLVKSQEINMRHDNYFRRVGRKGVKRWNPYLRPTSWIVQ
jgi:hypothetical protein